MESISGLTASQAKDKLKEFGLNEIQEVNKVSPFKILLRQVKKNMVIYLLTITMIVSFFLGKSITGFVIIAVIAVVVLTGFIQEYKAEKAISALKKMITPIANVIRDKREQQIPATEIVPGDILVLRTGERIPADCKVIKSTELKVNEAMLTGESTDISKSAASNSKLKEDNKIYMGTYIVNGKCMAEVIHTGMNTKFGHIAGMISTAEKHLPLQDKVNDISKYMVYVGLTAAVLTGIVLVARADSITADVIANILIVVIALSVSSFPEGFPVVLITTLAAGVNRMAKQNAVVNRMSIIETLGETSVICSDKTGTITHGEMTVREIYTNGKVYDVSGAGYGVDGSIVNQNSTNVDIDKHKELSMLLKTSVLCNDSSIFRLENKNIYKVSGSSTEGALLIAAAKLKVYKEEYESQRIDEIAFNSERKMMSVAHHEGDNKVVYVKGAPEVILSNCSRILKNGKIIKLTNKEKDEIISKNQDFASDAMRSLAFAYKSEKMSDKRYTEDDLIFIGLAAMEDPPREEVADAIKLCFRSGIKVKMITGDNMLTAQAIAKQIGLEGETLLGSEINEMTDEELLKTVQKVVIFARVKPEHKLRIVKALKENGEIVTMTGDGVNDAPALKESHIGVAMGINGTDVSRSVADITLKDDNFATIVNAIKEGRTVFNNIQKFVTYQLSCNWCDIYILFIGMILAPWLGWYVPIITALQILFINIVTDNMPAITLGFNPTSKDIMKEKPRKNAKIITNEFLNVIIFTGVAMGIIILFITYLSFNILDFHPEVARTTVLASLIMIQIANAYNFRSFRSGVLTRSPFVNKYLVLATFGSITATLAIIYLPPLQIMFETTPLQPISWLIAASAGFMIVLLIDVIKVLNKKEHFLKFKA